MTQCCKHTGAAVFHCPLTNKGVAFTEKEREELGLSGLLPTAVSTNDQQVERMHEILDRFEKPIDKALVLHRRIHAGCVHADRGRILPAL